ncbi:MAG: hypothetical protein A2086_06520 [Spirochaetes bacterium GWD1_27_9]|nr:MAG: hypothetical protein A2086_06520 [Spirochaetes bacterium GWD1_27_9]
MEIREKILDKKHPDLAQSYNNLSTIYYNMGDFDKAIDYCQKAIGIMKFNFPNGHPNLTTSIKNLEFIKKIKNKSPPPIYGNNG